MSVVLRGMHSDSLRPSSQLSSSAPEPQEEQSAAGRDCSAGHGQDDRRHVRRHSLSLGPLLRSAGYPRQCGHGEFLRTASRPVVTGCRGSARRNGQDLWTGVPR
jgi:hypothetical protein